MAGYIPAMCRCTTLQVCAHNILFILSQCIILTVILFLFDSSGKQQCINQKRALIITGNFNNLMLQGAISGIKI